MDCVSSSRLSSRNRVRGWCGLGSIKSMSRSRAPVGAMRSGDCGLCFGSGSRIKALKPLPSAFLAIGNHLSRELDIARCSCTMYVIENNRLTMTRRLGKAHVARNYSLEHLLAEKASEI